MMKSIFLRLAALSCFILGAAMPTNAEAAESEGKLLSGVSFPVNYEITGGKAVLETVAGSLFKCTEGKSSGNITSRTMGNITSTFTGCEGSGFKCNTTGRGAGEIIIKGAFTFRFDSLTPLGVAWLLSVEETAFECTSLLKVKLRKGGTVPLLINPLNTEVTEFELIAKQSKGKPEDSKYWESGVETHPLLLVSINSGTFEEAAVGSELNKAKTLQMIIFAG